MTLKPCPRCQMSPRVLDDGRQLVCCVMTPACATAEEAAELWNSLPRREDVERRQTTSFPPKAFRSPGGAWSTAAVDVLGPEAPEGFVPLKGGRIPVAMPTALDARTLLAGLAMHSLLREADLKRTETGAIAVDAVATADALLAQLAEEPTP